MTAYRVFKYNGTEYRARLENEILHSLCYRKSSLYPWRVTSKGAHFIWREYTNGQVAVTPPARRTEIAPPAIKP